MSSHGGWLVGARRAAACCGRLAATDRPAARRPAARADSCSVVADRCPASRRRAGWKSCRRLGSDACRASPSVSHEHLRAAGAGDFSRPASWTAPGGAAGGAPAGIGDAPGRVGRRGPPRSRCRLCSGGSGTSGPPPWDAGTASYKWSQKPHWIGGAAVSPVSTGTPPGKAQSSPIRVAGKLKEQGAAILSIPCLCRFLVAKTLEPHSFGASSFQRHLLPGPLLMSTNTRARTLVGTFLSQFGDWLKGGSMRATAASQPRS